MSVTDRVKAIKERASGRIEGADGIFRSKEDEDEINLWFAMTFKEPVAMKVLAYLKSVTINNLQGPGVTTEELRHLEGQRYLAALMERRIEIGRRTAGNR